MHAETDRKWFIEDLETREHARKMMVRKKVSKATWDVAYWGAKKLDERLAIYLGCALGGLMGEW